MKLKFESEGIQVIGTCEISGFPSYNLLLNGLLAGQDIVCKSDLIVNDKSNLFAFILYDKNKVGICNYSFTGKVEFLGAFPEYNYPFAYRFYPEKLVKAGNLIIDDITGEPIELIIESKKL